MIGDFQNSYECSQGIITLNRKRKHKNTVKAANKSLSNIFESLGQIRV